MCSSSEHSERVMSGNWHGWSQDHRWRRAFCYIYKVMVLENEELKIFNEILSWANSNQQKNKEDIEAKVFQAVKKANYLKQDWQVDYAVKRIVGELEKAIKAKYGKKLNKKNKTLAILSLVFAIIGGYPLLSTAAIIGVACGHIALVKIKKHPDKYTGRGLAVAGLVLGYLGIVLGIAIGVMRGFLNNMLGL